MVPRAAQPAGDGSVLADKQESVAVKARASVEDLPGHASIAGDRHNQTQLGDRVRARNNGVQGRNACSVVGDPEWTWGPRTSPSVSRPPEAPSTKNSQHAQKQQANGAGLRNRLTAQRECRVERRRRAAPHDVRPDS